MTDDLTGLHNLRSFEERLRIMVRVARETKTPLSLLVLDLDRLKSLNDVHGHLAGAEAVRTLGEVLAARLPRESTACRYGGQRSGASAGWRPLSRGNALNQRWGGVLDGRAERGARPPLGTRGSRRSDLPGCRRGALRREERRSQSHQRGLDVATTIDPRMNADGGQR